MFRPAAVEINSKTPERISQLDLGSEIGRVSGAVFSMAPPPDMPPLSQIDHAGLITSTPSDRHAPDHISLDPSE
jgi:hypothetical protein